MEGVGNPMVISVVKYLFGRCPGGHVRFVLESTLKLSEGALL